MQIASEKQYDIDALMQKYASFDEKPTIDLEKVENLKANPTLNLRKRLTKGKKALSYLVRKISNRKTLRKK